MNTDDIMFVRRYSYSSFKSDIEKNFYNDNDTSVKDPKKKKLNNHKLHSKSREK